PLQQVLIDLQVEVPGDRRVEERCGAVEQAARIDKRDGPTGPGGELLRVLRHELTVSLRQGRGFIQERVGLRGRVVPGGGAQVQGGIQTRRRGPDLADDSAAAAEPSTAAQTIPVDADSRRANAGRPGRYRCIHLPQEAAALGAPKHFARQKRAVALHRDIQIVLQRQGDHVLHGKIAIPAAESCSAWPLPPPVFPDGRASANAPHTLAAPAFGWKLQTIGHEWSSPRQAGPRRRRFGDDSFFPGAEPGLVAIAVPQRVYAFQWGNAGALPDCRPACSEVMSVFENPLSVFKTPAGGCGPYRYPLSWRTIRAKEPSSAIQDPTISNITGANSPGLKR